MNWKKVIFILALLATGVAAVLPALSRTSNCGGNSAALSRVSTYALIARVGVAASTNGSFQVTAANEDDRVQLTRLGRYHWIPGARFLVSTNALTEKHVTARRIIVVCDKPYKNVPRRWIGFAPATHAVGYSDGSTGLISPADFEALDRSFFAFLDQLYPEK